MCNPGCVGALEIMGQAESMAQLCSPGECKPESAIITEGKLGAQRKSLGLASREIFSFCAKMPVFTSFQFFCIWCEGTSFNEKVTYERVTILL